MKTLYLISTDYKNLTKVRVCNVIRELDLQDNTKCLLIEVDIPISIDIGKGIEYISNLIIKPRGYNYSINENCEFPIYVNIYIPKENFNLKEINDLTLLLTGDIYKDLLEAKKLEDKMKEMGRVIK